MHLYACVLLTVFNLQINHSKTNLNIYNHTMDTVKQLSVPYGLLQVACPYNKHTFIWITHTHISGSPECLDAQMKSTVKDYQLRGSFLLGTQSS